MQNYETASKYKSGREGLDVLPNFETGLKIGSLPSGGRQGATSDYVGYITLIL